MAKTYYNGEILTIGTLNTEFRDAENAQSTHSHASSALGPLEKITLTDPAADPGTDGHLQRNGNAIRYRGPSGVVQFTNRPSASMPGARGLNTDEHSASRGDHSHGTTFTQVRDKTHAPGTVDRRAVCSLHTGVKQTATSNLSLSGTSTVILAGVGICGGVTPTTISAHFNNVVIAQGTAREQLGNIPELYLMRVHTRVESIAAGTYPYFFRLDMGTSNEYGGLGGRVYGFQRF